MKYKDREYEIPSYSVFRGNAERLKKEVLPLIDSITEYLENSEKSREKLIYEILNFSTPNRGFLNKKHINKQFIDDIVVELNKIKKEAKESEKQYGIEFKITEEYINNLLSGRFTSKRGRKTDYAHPIRNRNKRINNKHIND